MKLNLDEIGARANAATLGPWEIREVLPRAIYQQGERGYHASTVDSENDANFIAHARTDIPLLIAELRTAREALRDAKEVLEDREDIAGALAMYHVESPVLIKIRKALGEE